MSCREPQPEGRPSGGEEGRMEEYEAEGLRLQVGVRAPPSCCVSCGSIQELL